MSAPQRKTDWTAPQVLLAIFGAIMAALGSYQAFRTDASNALAELRARVVNLEHRLDRVEDRKP